MLCIISKHFLSLERQVLFLLDCDMRPTWFHLLQPHVFNLKPKMLLIERWIKCIIMITMITTADHQLSETWKSWSGRGGSCGRMRVWATGCCRWLVWVLASSLGSWVWQVCVPTDTEWVKVFYCRCWMKRIRCDPTDWYTTCRHL